MPKEGKTKTAHIRTEKQLQIMKVIIRGNSDGTFCDLDQIVERVPYDTVKASMQFSIRALIRRGLVEKKDFENRRGAKRRILAPTGLGYRIMKEK